MAKLLLVRMTGALGLLMLAFVIVGLTSFLSVDPTAWAALSSRGPGFSVNHEFKGDRLPTSSAINAALLKKEMRVRGAPREIPVGCDAAFSPISAPRLSYIYGRCAT
jgi:hypothetical protein